MASLSLIQNYSSDEEEEKNSKASSFSDNDEEESNSEPENNNNNSSNNKTKISRSHAPNSSILPSALDAFSQAAGMPEFLNNAVGYVEKKEEMKDEVLYRGKKKGRRDKKDLPAGVVMEAKAQLVGIRDRVRSDIEGSSPAPTSANTNGEGKRIASASNPDAKDAADLLRMCLQCGVPKTYSHNQGMVCPICGDRPPTNPQNKPEKKKGSTIKDKEKDKRMKGQSSHASWKSETEMQLRQQFD